MKRRITRRPGAAAALLMLGGMIVIGAMACGDDNATPAVCSTDQAWLDGDRESPLMHPGGNCITCHSQDEGPVYAVAGTVHGAVDDDTNCYGVKGVKVTLTGADGNTLEMNTNEAGNFFSNSRNAVKAPYSATISQGGQTREMITAQSDFNCANCHTADGANGAPGRIFAP